MGKHAEITRLGLSTEALCHSPCGQRRRSFGTQRLVRRRDQVRKTLCQCRPNFHSPQEKSRLRKAVFNSRQRPPQLWAVSNVSAWQSREGESTAGSAAIKSVHPDQFS